MGLLTLGMLQHAGLRKIATDCGFGRIRRQAD